jgi:transposase
VSKKLQVKEVQVEGRRYVVCLNEEEARKDQVARESMVKALEEKLSKGGPKSLVGNRGYARFLKTKRGALEIDYEAVKRDERLDGKFVLRTTTRLSAEEVAQAYKSLWRVERTFREQKSTLEVRPIYHQKDSQCVGHIVASFLALRLEVDLQRALDERGVEVSWPELMGDLGQLQAVHIALDGQSYLIRTDLVGITYQAFLAAGVKIPPRVQPVGIL